MCPTSSYLTDLDLDLQTLFIQGRHPVPAQRTPPGTATTPVTHQRQRTQLTWYSRYTSPEYQSPLCVCVFFSNCVHFGIHVPNDSVDLLLLRTRCPQPQSAVLHLLASSHKSLELRTTTLIQTRSRYSVFNSPRTTFNTSDSPSVCVFIIQYKAFL